LLAAIGVTVESMKLSELLRPEAIRIPLEASDKEAAIAELVTLLERTHDIDSDGEVLSRVIARESMMSTGIGQGVAIPHAKARAAPTVVASCGVTRTGLEYESLDGDPVRLMILVVSPEAERGLHVRALAAISRLMLSAETRERLIGAPDVASFRASLRAAERHLD
jgi:mannitol/fructose-specific phosphotransferase system IIA component (Ntr-type)